MKITSSYASVVSFIDVGCDVPGVVAMSQHTGSCLGNDWILISLAGIAAPCVWISGARMGGVDPIPLLHGLTDIACNKRNVLLNLLV
jgi:hypothetical protein